MISIRVFLVGAFVLLQVCLLTPLTSAQPYFSAANFEKYQGERICTNSIEFGEAIHQETCNSMRPENAQGPVNAKCESITLNMLNSNNEIYPFTGFVVVCRYNGSVIGCACADITTRNVWKFNKVESDILGLPICAN